MAMAAVSVNAKGLQEAIIYIKETRKNSLNLTIPLKKAGLIMLRSIENNFKSGGRPLWRPLSPGYAKWKASKGYSPLPLTKSGDLRRSIVYRAERKRLAIGTSIPYSRYHQLGTSRIPKREFLLFQNQDLDRIEELILKHMVQNG